MFIGSVLGGGVSEIDFVAGGVADVGNVSGFATIGLSNGRHHTLTLTGTNFAAVVGAAITVDDGNSGNTVTAATLPAKDRIIVHAGAGLDKLTGGRGNDVFFAGGDTVMTGKAGTNEFTFSAPGGNTVGDFAVSATNEIVFSDQGFNLGLTGASGTPQALPAGLFVENSNGHFTGTSQSFAYATGTGDLFYSASGSSGTPTLVSHFTGAPSLAAIAALLHRLTARKRGVLPVAGRRQSPARAESSASQPFRARRLQPVSRARAGAARGLRQQRSEDVETAGAAQLAGDRAASRAIADAAAASSRRSRKPRFCCNQSKPLFSARDGW